MAAPLDPKLADLLVKLVELDDGEYETFVPHFSAGGMDARLLGHKDVFVAEGPIKELTRRGYLEMEVESGKKLGRFSITSEGRSLAAQLIAPEGDAIDLSWKAVEPVLRQVHDLWKSEGAPQPGVSGEAISDALQAPMATAQLAAVLQELGRAEWVETKQGWGPPLPFAVRPTPRTLSRFDGWPAQDARIAGEQFVALLEQRVEAEPDQAKRSKLRAALETGGSALKDLSVEVAAAIVARQVGG